MEQLWNRGGATGGKGSRRQKPQMVRRGSTVRVRQRASGFFLLSLSFRSLKRLACGLFGFEPAALQPPGVPTRDPIAVGPDRLAAMAPRLQLENMTLLLHPVLLARRTVRSSSGRSVRGPQRVVQPLLQIPP